MDVVLASDDYYFAYIYVAVKTIFQSNSKSDITVHYIQQDVSKTHIDMLLKLGTEFEKVIEIIEFKLPKDFDGILPSFGKSSKTTYAKFWFASMFPKLERVLYLDPDVMVLGSLEEMYHTDLTGNLIAGVYENLPEYHRTASKLALDDAYINGGMVLCNLELWRKEKFEESALTRLKDNTINLNYDQGILNELCKGKIKIINPEYCVLAEVFEFADAAKLKKRYNIPSFYSQEQITRAIKHPIIVHFTGFFYGKPLNLECSHPYAPMFRKIIIESDLEDCLFSKKLNKKVRLRRFVFRHMPFNVYLILERILDIHRKKEILC